MPENSRIPPQFTAKKAKILQQLAVPDGEYTDLSPKGSVDEGIRTLIDEVNRHEGLVTTSSCAGRVSVFLEGRKTAEPGDASTKGEAAVPAQLATVGGKGGGGKWLYVSHDPIALSRKVKNETEETGPTRQEGCWATFFGLNLGGGGLVGESTHDADEKGRLVHFKFEPMVRSPSGVL